MKTPRSQRGAALLVVIALFLIILPIALLAIFGRTLQNDTFSGSYLWRAQARDAANQQMAALRSTVAQSIGNDGLLEYQASPPAWYIGNTQNVQPNSASFWSGCQTNNLCQATTVTLNNGTGRQNFQVLQLVTPTGVIDDTLCNPGYIAVFYNVWVQATATANPAAGSATTQAVYRACILQ
jgi:Tfp pilus assembly protein PilX